MEPENNKQKQLDHIQEAGSKSEGSWFIAEKDIPHNYEAQQRHFLNYVLNKMSTSGLIRLNHIQDGNLNYTTATQDSLEPSKPHFDKTMISKLVQSYAQELHLQGGLNELSIIQSASHETDPRTVKIDESTTTQVVDQISRVIEEQSRIPVSMQMTTNFEKNSMGIDEQTKIPVSNWQDTTNQEIQSLPQNHEIVSGQVRDASPLNQSVPYAFASKTNFNQPAMSTMPNNSIVASNRQLNLDVPISSVVHETTSSRHQFSKISQNVQPDFGFLDIPSPQLQRPSKHLKKKRQNKPEQEESEFTRHLRLSKERLSKMEPEMTTYSEHLRTSVDQQRYETPAEQSLRPQLAHASDIIAKMKQYSNNIYQIIAIPEEQNRQSDEDQRYTVSERDSNSRRETSIPQINSMQSSARGVQSNFRKSQNIGSDIETQTYKPPVDSKIVVQDSKQYVVFSDAGSQIESVKTKYGKFNNPTSKNSKMMPGFRTVKNYAIQPPNVNFAKNGPKQNKERTKARRGVLAQNLQDLGFDPLETVSYLTPSEFLIQIISRNQKILNWHLSPSRKLNLLDVQIFSYPDNILKSESIHEPQVFQNQLEGFNIDQIKQKKRENLSMISKISESHLKIGYPVILKQLLYVKSINPLKAYTLRYKFFQLGEELLTEHDLIQRYKDLNMSAQFNLKISESIEDALKHVKCTSNPFCFQTLSFDFLVNLKSGRPDLIDIQPSCFDQPCESIPQSYKDCLLSLLLKIDKQVRVANGMNPNLNYNPTVFRTFWQKIVDYDMTDVDVRYDVPLKAKRVRVQKSPSVKSKASDDETVKDYGGLVLHQRSEERPDEASEVSMPSFVEKIQRNYQPKPTQESQYSSESPQPSFIISNKDYSIQFSEDEYPDEKIILIQSFLKMYLQRQKFQNFKKAVIILQKQFRQKLPSVRNNAIDHNIMVMKVIKLSNSLEQFKNHQIHMIQRSFYQIQKVTHEINQVKVPAQIIMQADQVLTNPQMAYETLDAEVESLTEKVNIAPGVGRNSSKQLRESQQSMYTRLLASEVSIKGIDNIPKMVKERIETPLVLSVDRNTPEKTQRESDHTKQVQIRKNVLEKDPFVQYQEKKKLKIPEQGTQSVMNERISVQMVSEPGSPSRSVQINTHLQIQEKSEKNFKIEKQVQPIQSEISQKSRGTSKPVSQKISKKSLNEAKSNKQFSTKSKQSKRTQKEPLTHLKKPKIPEIPIPPHPTASQAEPIRIINSPLNSSPDKVGALSINESPMRKSAMASIIISGNVVMDDESSLAMTEKGVQYSIQAMKVDQSQQCAKSEEKKAEVEDKAVQGQSEEVQSQQKIEGQSKEVIEKSEHKIEQVEPQIPAKDPNQESSQKLNPTQSAVTLASHLRNADDPGDENVVADHREIGQAFNDSMSLKNEQSDNPVENYHKIKPQEPKFKLKQTSNQSIPVEDEGNQDSLQPFQKFGGSKKYAKFQNLKKGQNTTSQIKEQTISEEQSQGGGSQRSSQKEQEQVISQRSEQEQVVSQYSRNNKRAASKLSKEKSYTQTQLQNIVGSVKMSNPQPKVSLRSLNPQLSDLKSVYKPQASQLSHSIDYGRQQTRVPSPIYELPKKKRHNMRDPNHVVNCAICIRKQQARLEKEASKPQQAIGPPMNSVRQRYKQNILARSLELPERTQRKRKSPEKRFLLPSIIKQNDERMFIQNFLQSAKEPEELKRQRFLEKKLLEQAQEIETIRQMQDQLLKISATPQFPQIQSQSSNLGYSPDILSPNSALQANYNPFSHNSYK